MSSAALNLVNTNVRVEERAAPFKLGYRPALDGLRGVAILAVLAFHTHHILARPLVKGGSIGVDIFFVLSGFLITVVLLEEWQRSGSISLKIFYWRRVLRLGPALLVLLAFMYVFANVFLLPVEANQTRRALPITFVYASDLSLSFFNIRLGALQHTWSLAIEEHFYLVWPLLLVAGLKLGISRRWLILITLLLAVASMVQRATLHQLGAPPVRTYYGIDTRADALLIGCAAGMAVSWSFLRSSSMKPLLIPALLLIGLCLIATDYASPLMHLGGFTLLAFAAAVLVVNSVLLPSSQLTGLFEARPLVWVGRISYGLYLWHYPVFKAANLLQLGWAFKLSVAITATFAVTCLSYYLIERPALNLKRKFQAEQLS